MRNNKFISNTLTLIMGGLVTKILSFIIKILYTRTLGIEGLSLFTLIAPTFSLIYTIAGFGMPQALAKVIAENNGRTRKILEQGIIILLILNFVIMGLVIFASDFIARVLLNEPRVKILIMGMVLAMPNMALACVLKGYFYGKQRMLPNTISNVVEQLIRIIFIIFFLPYFIKKNIVIGVLSYLLINVVTEGASILTFLFLLPKGAKVSLSDFSYDKSLAGNLMATALPLVSARIIGNIGYFFEPIILANTFRLVGYSNSYFLYEYGIYNGYSLALLLMPSFLIQAISTSLIPEIAKFKGQRNKDMIKRRVRQALFLAVLIGGCSSIFIVLLRMPLLKIIYNTNLGGDYVFVLGLFFVLYYIEAPASSILQALGYGNFSLKITTIGVFIKLSSMFIFTLLRIGLWSLVIAEAVNILFVVLASLGKIKTSLA